ncbi:MAG: histidine phosphatase family protein [Pseudomonadota bacterium]
METLVRYLSHPQVIIDPEKEVPRWSLSKEGLARVLSLNDSGALRGTTRVISSGETKAIETARPLAAGLNGTLEIRELMHENDRSATGFLPPDEFEACANQFFSNPSMSVRGWEPARDAQQRILAEIDACLEQPTTGDILIVGHGGVGTLLYCALAGLPIDRKYDQGPNGGGNWYAFTAEQKKPLSGWAPMETLYTRGDGR